MVKKDSDLIIVKNICKSFNKRIKNGWFCHGKTRQVAALKNISFTVGRGETLGIIGPNGSGKSTLIRILSTLLLPDKGYVKIFGLDLKKDAFRVRDMINRVSVEAAFYKTLSARENLVYSAILYGENPKSAELRGAAILEQLGLHLDSYDQPMDEMSRGMQQKIAITRALLSSPSLILFVEPTTGLDPKAKKIVQDFILDLNKKYNATIIITSHDMGEVERLATRVAFISKGAFIAQGTIEELKKEVGEETLEKVFMQLSEDEEIY